MSYYNRVKFTTSTTGTGSITVGAAAAGFQTPAAAGSVDGGHAFYTIENGTAWEIGVTTFSSGGTVMARQLEQSSTGSLLNLSGTSTVFLTPSARELRSIPKAGIVQQLRFGIFLN